MRSFSSSEMGIINALASAGFGAASAVAVVIFLMRSGTVTIPVRKRRVTQTSSPNPAYREGDKQHHPFGTSPRLQLSPSELGAALYPFVISSVVPRPIAFISSVSKEVIATCGSGLAAGPVSRSESHTLSFSV